MNLRRSLRDLYHRVMPAARSLAGGGHTQSARYCYSVWMRHFMNLQRLLGEFRLESVAEIGPGRSLGTGLAALLSGADRLYAFDLLEYTDVAANVSVFDDLVALYRRREPIPDAREFPRVLPLLRSYEFPGAAFPPERLQRNVSDERVANIRNVLRSGLGYPPIGIRYVAPWNELDPTSGESVDFVFSQAVMLYVSDLDSAYQAMSRWLRPGGVMSHTINFTSIGFTPGWDSHWKYSRDEWDRIEGHQPYRISRLPLSAHLRAMEHAGFEVIDADCETAQPTLDVGGYHASFDHLTDADRRTARSVLVARKR
jgi:SAM-dependent methyltransferase